MGCQKLLIKINVSVCARTRDAWDSSVDVGNGEGNIACHRSEARGRILCDFTREMPREPSFGQLMRRTGKACTCATFLAFRQVPRSGSNTAKRWSESEFPTSRETEDGHPYQFPSESIPKWVDLQKTAIHINSQVSRLVMEHKQQSYFHYFQHAFTFSYPVVLKVIQAGIKCR